MRVLLVDDDSQASMMLEKFLGRRKHVVTYAENGEVAWNLLVEDKDAFDLVLTDIRMPVMDGLTLTSKIRRNRWDIPVVLMTAFAEWDSTIQALQLDAFDFIIKPVDLDVLTRSLARIEKLEIDRQELAAMLPFHSGSCTFSIPSKLKYVDAIVAQFQQQFGRLFGLHQIDVRQMGLCVLEALVNATVHGNLEVDSSIKEESWAEFDAMIADHEQQPRYAERLVTMNCSFDHNQFEWVIIDEGPGFDPSILPDMEDPLSFDCSGRGILLIRSFMDHVGWNQRGNVIRMVKYLGSTPENLATE